MLVYDVDIEFEFGQIGIDAQVGVIDSKMVIQESFGIETELPELSIVNSFPIIDEVDISDCRTDMGYPQPLVASTIWHNEARQYVIEYIGTKAAGGNALGDIEKGTTIADIVERESFQEPPEINIDAVPKTPPRITFRYGETKANLSCGSVKVDVSDKPVTVDYNKAKVNIFMKKNPYIAINVVHRGKTIDQTV